MKEKKETRNRWHAGWLPTADTYWKVETIKNEKFVYIGKLKVSGKLVRREMNAHQSIKGYEAYDIAQRLAFKKFKVNPVIVTEIYPEEEPT